MPQCPVCKKTFIEPLPAFCPTPGCGWELGNDLALNPSFAIPEEVLDTYKTRLQLARDQYRTRLALESRVTELEGKLSDKEKENEAYRTQSQNDRQQITKLNAHVNLLMEESATLKAQHTAQLETAQKQRQQLEARVRQLEKELSIKKDTPPITNASTNALSASLQKSENHGSDLWKKFAKIYVVLPILFFLLFSTTPGLWVKFTKFFSGQETKTIKNQKESIDNFNRENTYYEKDGYDRKIADCTRFIEIYPKFDGAYLKRGFFYRIKGDYDRAIDDYTRAIKINPKNGRSYNNRGLVYDNKGDYDRAIADYTRAIEINPQDDTAYTNRGFAYKAKGLNDLASKDFDMAEKLMFP